MFNNKKLFAGVSGLILAFLITGCSLFPNNNTKNETPTRPSPTRSVKPTRPAPTRPAPMNPSPTKKVPGVSAKGTQQLTSRIKRIESAIKAKDWAKANSETNAMAGDMARFKPTDKNTVGKKAGNLPDMAKLDAVYARLQADVKTKNATKSMADLKEMRSLLTGKTNMGTTGTMKTNK